MILHVQFLGTVRELLGSAGTRVELPEAATVGILLSTLLDAHPALIPHRAQLMVTVGLDFVEPNHTLHPGEPVSLLLPA